MGCNNPQTVALTSRQTPLYRFTKAKDPR